LGDIVFAPFLIILLPLSFFCQKFVQHISRRLLNGNQWNFTGMLSTMSRCADFLSSLINFCLASNLLWSFLCFSIC
jgi:hypothetical protein